MKDYQAHLESLRNIAAESALINNLATVPQKRELFAKLAAHLNTLAAEVERAMVAANDEASGIGSDTRPNKPNFDRRGVLGMAKSSKLIASKRGKVLLVRRKGDRLWMFPGGRKRGAETAKQCLRREIKEELPKLKVRRLSLWKEVKTRNRRSGRKMSDAIFVAKAASGALKIGDKQEIDRATWRKPWGIRLTPTSRYIRDKLFPKV